MSDQSDNTYSGRGPPGNWNPAAFERFKIEDYIVDPASNRVIHGNQVDRLEPKVIAVLVYLASHPGDVVTREALEASVWAGTIVGYDSVTSAIQKLRKVFNDDPKRPRIIETLTKKGYRLLASPQTPASLEQGIQAKKNKIFAGSSGNQHPWRYLSVLLLLLTAAALLWRLNPWQSSDNSPSIDLSPRSIAVLPFVNLSTDTEQEYLADGITDDLITELAKRRDLLVIARDSTFVYKNKSTDLRKVADQLGVRYLLRGSIRREDKQLRINVQLIDTRTMEHLWAERYDGTINQVFKLQDSITRKVGTVLALATSTGGRADFGGSMTSDAGAYDNFLYGKQHFYLYANKKENEKAREYFEKAVAFDENFAMAYAMLAWTYAFEAMNAWTDDREHSLTLAHDLASKALALQEALPFAYFVRGLAYREQGEYVKALVEANKAIEYDPNYANAHVLLATLLYYANRPQESLERIQKAIQLNPHHPYNYSFHLGQAYFVLRRYDDAIEALNKGVATNPAAERLHVWLAAAYAHAGKYAEAEWEGEQVLILNPEFSIQRVRDTFSFGSPADRDHLIEGLRQAGLPP